MPTLSTCVRLAIEETPRPEGAATTTPYQVSTVTRDLPYTSFSPAPNITLLDRLGEMGYGEDTQAGTVDSAAPTAGFAVRAYPDDLTWLLGLPLVGTYTAGDGVITAGTGIDATVIPAGAARWVFNKRTTAVPKTAQFIAAFPNTPLFIKIQSAAVTRLGGNHSGELTADMITGFQDWALADPNITPVYSTNVSFTRRDITLTWLAGSGSPSEFTWNINNPCEYDPQLGGIRSTYPTSVIRGDARTTVDGTVNIKNFKTQDAVALVNGSTFSALVRWVSNVNIGATAYPFSLFMHFPKCQIVGGGPEELTGAKRRLGGTLNWAARYDSTAGYESRIVLVNSVTSISTVGN